VAAKAFIVDQNNETVKESEVLMNEENCDAMKRKRINCWDFIG